MSVWRVLRNWGEGGRWRLSSRLAWVGALAGFVAWAFVVLAHFVFGVTRPTGAALIWAILRGAGIGVLLGLLFSLYWKRRGGRDVSPTSGSS